MDGGEIGSSIDLSLYLQGRTLKGYAVLPEITCFCRFFTRKRSTVLINDTRTRIFRLLLVDD